MVAPRRCERLRRVEVVRQSRSRREKGLLEPLLQLELGQLNHAGRIDHVHFQTDNGRGGPMARDYLSRFQPWHADLGNRREAVKALRHIEQEQTKVTENFITISVLCCLL